MRTQTLVNVTSDLKATVDSVQKAINDACKLAIKQTSPKNSSSWWLMQASEALGMSSW